MRSKRVQKPDDGVGDDDEGGVFKTFQTRLKRLKNEFETRSKCVENAQKNEFETCLMRVPNVLKTGKKRVRNAFKGVKNDSETR